MSKLSIKRRPQKEQKNQGLLKNPLFYFGMVSLFLWGMPFFSFGSLTQIDNFKAESVIISNPFFKDTNNLQNEDLFFSQNNQIAKESPDLKIIENEFVYGISTPRILTTQTLGSILGESSPSESGRREIIEHHVESGETVLSIAKKYGLSTTAVAQPNEISVNSSLEVGRHLIILPVDGLLHEVRAGDTVSSLGAKYKAKSDDIINYNNLINEGDIFVGDVLVIPYGKMPTKSAPSTQVALPNSFFIYPTEGIVTQGIHYYNAIDVANKCGTPIYAAASGTVQRARFDYVAGNYITIAHSNGTSTHYGHLQTMLMKPGDHVSAGDRIGSMGSTGKSTGCHLHFGVTGAKNPLVGLKSTKYK